MNLTTLEQSKRLKAWGAPQDTYMAWVQFSLGDARLCPREMAFDYLSMVAAYDLETLIGWLDDDFGSLDQWEDDRPGFTAFPNQAKYDGNEAMGHNAKTTLEAVYALAEAIHGNSKGNETDTFKKGEA